MNVCYTYTFQNFKNTGAVSPEKFFALSSAIYASIHLGRFDITWNTSERIYYISIRDKILYKYTLKSKYMIVAEKIKFNWKIRVCNDAYFHS